MSDDVFYVQRKHIWIPILSKLELPNGTLPNNIHNVELQNVVQTKILKILRCYKTSK
jgi:hypothetical protein